MLAHISRELLDVSFEGSTRELHGLIVVRICMKEVWSVQKWCQE